MKLTTIANMLIWAAVTGAAQTPAPLPSFEVASVRPVALGSGAQTAADRERGFAGVGGRVYLRGINLSYLLIRAFDLQPDQLSGSAWLNNQAFDISAVAPADTPREKILLMIQNLLADRFKLKYHRETAVAPVYALVVGSNGPKLRPGIPDDAPENLGQIGATTRGAAPGTPVTATARASFGVYKISAADGVTHYEFQNISMKDFAQFLSQTGRRALELPVIDMTEMTGRYQVALDISQSDMLGPAASRLLADLAGADQAVPSASDPSGSSMRTSIEKQGLRLIRRSAPLEKFIIDQIERTPTEN